MERYGHRSRLGGLSGLRLQAFIYKVPEDFTLRTEEGETPQDVAPVTKLSGHSRYGSSPSQAMHVGLQI